MTEALATTLDGVTLAFVPIERIRRASPNLREKVDKEDPEYARLVASIRGLGHPISPLAVRPIEGTDEYDLSAGDRRLEACVDAGLSYVPVISEAMGDPERIGLMLDENGQRQGLTAIEEARGLQMLLEYKEGDVEKLSEDRRLSQDYVSGRVSLLRLPEEVIRKIHEGALTNAEGLLLAQLAHTPEYLGAALTNIGHGWNVTSAVSVEIKRRDRDRETEKSRVFLEKRGVTVIDPPRSVSFPLGSKTQKLGNSAYDNDVPMKVTTHSKLDCHAAYIEPGSGKYVYVCTNAPSHRPKPEKGVSLGGVGVVVTDPAHLAPAEKGKRTREENKRYRAAHTARGETIARLLRDGLEQQVIVDQLCRAIIAETTSSNAARACGLVGIDVPSYHADDKLREYAAAEPGNLLTAAFVAVLASAETGVCDNQYPRYNPHKHRTLVAEHFRFLQAASHSLIPEEQEIVDSAFRRSRALVEVLGELDDDDEDDLEAAEEEVVQLDDRLPRVDADGVANGEDPTAAQAVA